MFLENGEPLVETKSSIVISVKLNGRSIFSDLFLSKVRVMLFEDLAASASGHDSDKKSESETDNPNDKVSQALLQELSALI